MADILALATLMVVNIHQFQFSDYTNFIQALEASISSVVFIGAAILFLVTWENRIKRRRALKAIHELRALAHIIDMHQLTKDPESYFAPQQTTTVKRAMTSFELNRYLDYCSEGLALITLDETVPAFVPEAARTAVLTVSEAKGLDFHSVCVLDAGRHVDDIQAVV